MSEGPVHFIAHFTVTDADRYRVYETGFFPILNGGELAALYCFVFLYLAAAGGGPWSVDRLTGRDAPSNAS